jgi:hypothetical protein
MISRSMSTIETGDDIQSITAWRVAPTKCSNATMNQIVRGTNAAASTRSTHQ